MEGTREWVNPGWLEDTARKQLVIRCIQRSHPDETSPSSLGTTIVLYTINKFDGTLNGADQPATFWSLCEVVYKQRGHSRNASSRIEVNIHGEETADWFDFFKKSVVPGWKERVPLWLEKEPVVAVMEGPHGVSTIGYARTGLLKHYLRILLGIGDEMKSRPKDFQHLVVVQQQLLEFVFSLLEARERLVES